MRETRYQKLSHHKFLKYSSKLTLLMSRKLRKFANSYIKISYAFTRKNNHLIFVIVCSDHRFKFSRGFLAVFCCSFLCAYDFDQNCLTFIFLVVLSFTVNNISWIIKICINQFCSHFLASFTQQRRQNR